MKNKWLLLLYDRGKFSSTIYHLLSKSFLQICKVSSYYFRSSRLNYSPSNLGNGEATKMDQEQRQMRPEAEIGTTFLARHCFHSTDFGGKITTKRRKGIQTFFTRQNLPQQQWRHQLKALFNMTSLVLHPIIVSLAMLGALGQQPRYDQNKKPLLVAFSMAYSACISDHSGHSNLGTSNQYPHLDQAAFPELTKLL